MKWFDGLDTTRRIFVVVVSIYFLGFIYLNWWEIIRTLYLYFHNRWQFDLAMQIHDLDPSIRYSIARDPIEEMITALKEFGISIAVALALGYAIFKKKTDS